MAVCHQIFQEAGRPQFRRHMLAHILDTSQAFLEEKGIKDKGKANVWGIISKVYRNEGRWKEAEELEVQVMETRKRVLGKEHPDTLTSMGNLVWTYGNQGRWKEAEELEVQVMETYKRMLGKENLHKLASM